MSKQQIEYFKSRLDPIIGGRIVGTTVLNIEFFNEQVFGVRVDKDGKEFALWIYADEEGNGPGAIEIQEVE